MVLNLSQDVMNFKCVHCGLTYSIDHSQFFCSCGGLLEVVQSWDKINIKEELVKYENIPSGVWRFKPLIHPFINVNTIITRGEGHTGLYNATKKISNYAETSNIHFKHEGENPTGSFKDRGMTVAISEAKRLKVSKVICASTGNTSSSLAAYAAYGGLDAYVVIPKGKVALGKLAQAIAYGAHVLEIEGTFDIALKKVTEMASAESMYLLNSINPWRIEGQKTIIFELLAQRNWQVPDFIFVPAGNLGNTSAFGKALREAKELGLIDTFPRIVSVQADGAKPFVNYWETGVFKSEPKPQTLATAINIGNPVSFEKAIKTIKETNGLVLSVSDQEILDAKAVIDASGIGCEPASATTLAGIKKLITEGIVSSTDDIVAVLTGHILKDPEIITKYHSNAIDGIVSKYSNTFSNG